MQEERGFEQSRSTIYNILREQRIRSPQRKKKKRKKVEDVVKTTKPKATKTTKTTKVKQDEKKND